MALRFLNSGYFAGKVGIGTESPERLLSLYSDNTETTPRLLIEQDGTGDAVMAFSLTSGQGWSMGIDNSLGDAFMIHNSAGGVDSSSQLTITNDGDVGIGTVSPYNKTHITTSVDGDGLLLDYAGSNNKYVGVFFKIDTNTSDAYKKGALVWERTGSYNEGRFHFLLNNDDNASNVDLTDSKVTILSTGNVGIGTDNPGRKLSVNGSIELTGSDMTLNTTSAAIRRGTSGQMFLEAPGDVTVTIDSNSNNTDRVFNVRKDTGSELFRIQENGNVGINTTSPDFKLDVGGTFGVSDLPFNSSSVSVLVADETIGAETITNGDFATDSDWTKSSNVSISGGQATFTANSAAQYIIQGSLWPANSLSGQKVKLTYTIVSNSLNGGNFRIGGYTGASAFTLNGLVTTVGTHNIILDVRTTAGDDNAIDLYITSAATSGALVIDNVSVKQVTSASNQILKRELGTGAFGPTPVGAYLPLAGGTMTGALKLNDNVELRFGDDLDLRMEHDGGGGYIQNYTGNFTIRNYADDTSIIFQNDNGGGGIETYFQLEGASGGVNPFTVFPDNSNLVLGSGHDLRLYHDGSNSYIDEIGTGSLIIKSSTIIEMKGANNEYLARFIENGSVDLYYNNSLKFETTGSGVLVLGDIQIDSALLSNQENTDVDTGTEAIASVVLATYTAAFFDFVIKKGTNVRSGTVYACHDGTSVAFTETSTQDLGDTSDVTLNVVISTIYLQLQATTTSDDWSIKSLIRAI